MGCLPEGCLKCDSLLWLWSINQETSSHLWQRERETLNFLSPIVSFSVLLTHCSNLRTVWMDNRWWEERWKLPCSLKAVLYWIYLFLFLSPPVKSSQSSQRMCFEREQRICLAKVTHIISLRPPPPNHLPWGYLLLPTSATLESCLHSRWLFHLLTATEQLVRVKYSFNLCLPGSYSVELIHMSFRCPHLYNRVVENRPSALRLLLLLALRSLALYFWTKSHFCFGELA